MQPQSYDLRVQQTQSSSHGTEDLDEMSGAKTPTKAHIKKVDIETAETRRTDIARIEAFQQQRSNSNCSESDTHLTRHRTTLVPIYANHA